MEVRTFRAASLQEALQQVRDSLGPDANVLHTRERKLSRFGMFHRTYIEVEASRDIAVASRFHSPTSTPASIHEARLQPAHQVAQPDGYRVSPTATALETPGTTVESAPKPPDIVRSRTAPLGPMPTSPSRLSEPEPTIIEESARAASVIANSGAFSTSERTTAEGMSPAMVEIMSELLDGGMPPRVARELLKSAVDACGDQLPNDPWLINGQISQQIAASIHVGGSIEIEEGEQQVIALVGPTGVGKTTTLAKIAAGLRFDLGLDVGLITLDTFRLGAVDQLLQYAELISAPLEVVSSADQVVGALQRLRESDVVLIDTAGRSPRDREQIALLGEFLQAAQPTATHLVVSAAGSAAHAQSTLENFAQLQPSNVLITKIDESLHFGGWLPMLQSCQLPVSYITTGQHVPEDIMVATRRRLASLILGHTQQQWQNV